LIMDTKKLRDELGNMEKFQTDGKADASKISEELKEVLELHRKSQMRADFVNAENSTGFHNPREASRMLLQAVDMAKTGQIKLIEIANANGINDFKTSNLGFEDMQKFNPGELYYKVDVNGHKAGERYYGDEIEVNGNPPKELLEHDKNLAPYNYQVIDKK
ncbi:TPA: ammonia-forming cytochrome c nitrite reductase subunit c552, partial [Campylobacter coli]|nr:ammonia-forming cytochrome c nitrite reductase subunit c552 [Campylobacter coli]HEG0289257.1 ammonia-forming cytochrome c nitrite reductase subunit c552 [Campylobacter coli]